VIAMIIPITTNTTIAICIHIQVGDTPAAYPGRATATAIVWRWQDADATMAGRPIKLTTPIVRGTVVALWLGVAWLCAAAALAPAGHALEDGSRASTSVPLGGINLPALSAGTRLSAADRQIATAKALRARVVRVDVPWSLLEPHGPGQIEAGALAFLDRLVSDAAGSGIRVITTVESTPCWASSAPAALLRKCSPERWTRANAWPPREPSAYAAFVAYLAARYGTRLAAIEIWNEPDQANEAYFAGPEKPQHYAAVLRAAYPAIKQANPNVKVLAGSLVGSNGVFLHALYAAGIKGYYDGLAVHFYNLTLGSLRAIHETQLANGDNTPLWLDEFGWSSCWPKQKIQQEQGCVSPRMQATNITNLYRSLGRAPYVAAAVLYKLQDSTRENFGVLNTKGARKPAFAALSRVLSNPFGSPTRVTLSLSRRHDGVLAKGEGPVGDYLQLEAFQGKVLRYRALFTLNRFNRYAILLPPALGTHGLTVRVYQYWQGSGRDAHRSI
jgi:hypothetical protein